VKKQRLSKYDTRCICCAFSLPVRQPACVGRYTDGVDAAVGSVQHDGLSAAESGLVVISTQRRQVDGMQPAGVVVDQKHSRYSPGVGHTARGVRQGVAR